MKQLTKTQKILTGIGAVAAVAASYLFYWFYTFAYVLQRLG
jgi:hypothetical protein